MWLKGCVDLMMIKLLRWTPRVLSIFVILLLLVFSLDVFDGGPLHLVLLGFLIHNIPTVILIGLTILSWKKPLFGAISFMFLGLVFIFFMVINQGQDSLYPILMIGLPLMIIGLLFLILDLKKDVS
jgi:hypothetical protein